MRILARLARGILARLARGILPLFALLAGGCLSFQSGPRAFYEPGKFVDLGRGKVYVEDHGDGPAVLLVHGFGASHTTWSAVVPALARHYRVLSVDLPGFGASDKVEDDYRTVTIARKLLKLLDKKGIDRAHVVAHSWGTAVALTMGQLAPARVRSLALMGSFAYRDQLPPYLVWARAPGVGAFLFGVIWTQRVDDRLEYSFYDADRFATPEVADRAREIFDHPGYLAASLAVARGIDFSDLEKGYRTMTTPVMVISGREDRVTRLPAARRLVADIPDARHVVIPRCGHLPPVEHPTKVVGHLFGFFCDVERRAGEPGRTCTATPAGVVAAPQGAGRRDAVPERGKEAATPADTGGTEPADKGGTEPPDTAANKLTGKDGTPAAEVAP